jgi:hypothetical protein
VTFDLAISYANNVRELAHVQSASATEAMMEISDWIALANDAN